MKSDSAATGAQSAASSASAPEGAPTEGASTRERGFLARHKRAAGVALLGVAVLGFGYYVVPQIAGLGGTLQRLRSGNPWWLALGVPLEAISLASYVVLFHAVLSRGQPRVGWRASYQIAMAGGGATKLFAAAGSGGVAVTVWALRAAGLSGDAVAREMTALDVLNYAVYMAALALVGLGLWLGLFGGRAPIGVTLVPALFAIGVSAAVLSMRWLAGPVERFMLRRAQRTHGRLSRWWSKAASVPRALQHGVGSAFAIVRSRDRSWLAAIPAWGFDIAVLWATFRAFGHSPGAAALIMGYYVGTLGNALPLPAGIGGVEGGMIGAFLALGVNGGLAVLAVLGYRTISYWLPLLPQGVGYVRLRGTVSGWRRRPEAGGRPETPDAHP